MLDFYGYDPTSLACCTSLFYFASVRVLVLSKIGMSNGMNSNNVNTNKIHLPIDGVVTY